MTAHLDRTAEAAAPGRQRHEHVQELRRGSRAQPHTPAPRKGTRATNRRRAVSDSADQ